MSLYRRAKKEDAVKPSKKEMSVHIGSVYDSCEVLQARCNVKANELSKSVELNDDEEMEVAFWTKDIPELICVAKIYNNESGLRTYVIDYSYSTL